MGVRSRRIAGPLSIAAGASDGVYTVPADRTLIIKQIVARSSVGGTVAVAYVGSAASANLIWNAVLVASVATVAPVWLVMHETEVLRLQADGSGAVVFSVHGALLLGDPA